MWKPTCLILFGEVKLIFKGNLLGTCFIFYNQSKAGKRWDSSGFVLAKWHGTLAGAPYHHQFGGTLATGLHEGNPVWGWHDYHDFRSFQHPIGRFFLKINPGRNGDGRCIFWGLVGSLGHLVVGATTRCCYATRRIGRWEWRKRMWRVLGRALDICGAS
jgi:hypothetical protein